MLKYKYIFQIKYTEAILPNSTRKLLWFEIIKMLISVKKTKFIVIYYNFRHTYVLYGVVCMCAGHLSPPKSAGPIEMPFDEQLTLAQGTTSVHISQP